MAVYLPSWPPWPGSCRHAACEIPATFSDSVHDSLEGIGGLITSEAYHSKADILMIPKHIAEKFADFLLEKMTTKFATFSVLLALPVMEWERHGQIRVPCHIMPKFLGCDVLFVRKSSETAK